MTGKSKHKRGKHRPQSRKRGTRQHFAATTTQQPAVTEARESIPHPDVPTPLASVPTRLTKPIATRYPHIATELRTIGILAGIMLIILVVLSLILS